MLSLLAKRNPCSVFRLLPILNAVVRRFCSSPATQTPNFMVDYLISSFGFSPDKAATVSKRIAHLKSPEKPDSVLHFFKHRGFTDAQIKTIIVRRPTILRCSPQNTIEPNFRALRDIGLSNFAIAQIILSDAEALRTKSGATRIKFWKDFLGGSEAALVRAIKCNRCLTTIDIAPRISFLQSYGLTTHEIRRIMLAVPGFLSRSCHLMEDLLHRAKELGFQPETAMFASGLNAVCSNSREALLKKMEFLTGEVGCEPSYVASNPRFLIASLEKRMRPRHNVLCLLDSKGLYIKKRSFLTTILLTDDKFVETYILPHKEEISGLHRDYLAACA